MRKVPLTDLRYHFPKVERLLRRGQTVQITKHGRVFARLVPVTVETKDQNKPPRLPDFKKRRRELFGDRIIDNSGILDYDRSRY